MFWLGPPAPKVLGSDSKTHLKSRCCAILIYNVRWLTGFDERCLQDITVAPRLQDHELLKLTTQLLDLRLKALEKPKRYKEGSRHWSEWPIQCCVGVKGWC